MQIGMKLHNLPAVTTRLETLPTRIDQAIDTLVTRTMTQVEATARPLTPFDTGHLRGSIHTTNLAKNTMMVTADAEYAPYQEFGTRHMKPHPFLKPAWEKHKPTIIPNTQTILNQILGG